VTDRYHAQQSYALSSVAAVGQAIQQRRELLGLTQAQLATSIGVNRRVLGELERGKETVRLGIALGALEALGLQMHATVPA
jgi:HTH-type transcriptional regulator/antitoxin HipB